MKKLILIVLGIAAIVSGCTSDEGEMLVEKQDDAPQMRVSRFRSVDEARNIAQQAIDALGSGARSTRTLKGNSGVTVVRTHASRSGDSDTIMYALDMEDDQGFVLIAAPSDMSPLIAVIENGSYSDPENLKNESYQFVLEATKNSIIESLSNTKLPLNPTPTSYIVVDSLNYKDEPTVKTNWNQAWPENMFVANKIAGCVPLANVTAMSVVEYPKSISYTFPEKDIASETINWTEVKKHKQSSNTIDQPANHYNTCNATPAAHVTLGRLVRQAGYICGAFDIVKDNKHSTGVYRDHVFDAIKHYLPSNMYKEANPALNLFIDLGRYKVAIIDYYTRQDNNGHGHTWIADGRWRLGMVKYYYQLEGAGTEIPKPGEIIDPNRYVLVKTEGKIEELLHYNWGWGGNCNGWFRSSTRNPQNPYQYDNYLNYADNVEYKYGGHYICIGKR